jgi:DNA end-binding protein Ku
MAKRRKKTARRRSSWKGQLRFGLVNVGVEAVNARSTAGGDIHFHQLHAKCHRRIHYEKVCPTHGKVENDEIVSGYEYAKGKYVEIEPEELDALRTERERSLVVDSFISPDELDLIYLDGRMYYLVPEPDSKDAYSIFVSALEHEQMWGVGHLVMSGKDQIVILRSRDGMLHMAMLNYSGEIKPVEEMLVKLTKPPAKQVKLAETLIRSWSENAFDFEDYEDRYRNRVAELIKDKIAGKETVEPEEEESEEPDVINLMDALKRSLKSRKPSRRKKSTRRKRAS